MNYFKKYHFLPIIAGFMAMALCNYSQYQVSALSYLLIEEFSLTSSQYAQIFTATMLPGVFLSLVLGILCDRFGLRRSFGAAIVISGIGLAGRVFAGSYMTVTICMVVSGLAVSFANSNAAKLVGSLYPADRADSIMGIMLVGSSAGMMFAMFTTARMFDNLKDAYIFAAVIFAVFIVYWYVCCTATPGLPPKDAGASANDASGGNAASDAPASSLKEDVLAIIKSPRVILIGLCLAALNGGLISVSSFLPLALQSSHGMDAVQSSTVTSLVLLGNMIGTVMAPGVIRKISRTPYLPMIGSQVLAFVGLTCMLKTRGVVLLYLLSILTGILINSTTSILYSLPLSMPEIGLSKIGTCGGLVATFQLAGAVIFPSYVVPNLTSSYPMMVFIAGLFFLLNALCIFILSRSMKGIAQR